MKPIWLLDVDGVINACPWDGEFPATHPLETWTLTKGTAGGREWPIRYSSVVIDRINELSERVEVRWLTTWKHEAPVLGKKLGLNEFSVQEEHPDAPYYMWWKMRYAAHSLLTEKRPIIWTDDDLAREWRKETLSLAGEIPVCLITPSTDSGLRVRELDEIEQFVAEQEASLSEAL